MLTIGCVSGQLCSKTIRSYIIVIVVTNIISMRTIKAYIIVMQYNTKTHSNQIKSTA